jgi:hypothetical protein
MLFTAHKKETLSLINALLFLNFSTLSFTAFAQSQQPLDYNTLTHTISIQSFRAGQHDPSGVNNYYFTAKMRALVNTADQIKLPDDQKKAKTVDLDNFGEMELKSLSNWKAADQPPHSKPDTKSPDTSSPFLKVDGDTIRELVASTMAEFNTKEETVEVEINLILFEKAKKYFFFGEDLKIAEATFVPLPSAGITAKMGFNQDITLTDDKGALVSIAVRFDNPNQQSPTVNAADAAAAAKSETINR